MEIPTYLIKFDPKNFESGIDLIAVTETPAIETLSLRFSETLEMKFSCNEDQQLIIGPAIIPDKPIFRSENGKDFYVVFTKEVIEQMVEKFNSEMRSVKFNIEHDETRLIEGFIKESWIVEDEKIDKSQLYGFSVPVGTWMISAKITDTQVWNSVIKRMDQVGFSIEGLMGVQKFYKQDKFLEDACWPGWEAIGLKPKGGKMVPNCVPVKASEFEEGVPHYTADGTLYEGPTHKDESGRLMTGATHTADSEYLYHEGEFANTYVSAQKFDSYTDYPKAASANAQRALDWAAKEGWGSCGTPVGKARANQLAKREAISFDTIKRMASFRRQQQNKNTPYDEGCGKLMWDAWGGDAGINWAERKVDQINKEKENLSKFINDKNKQNKQNKMKKTNKSRFFATRLNLKKKFNKASKKYEEVLISEEEEVLIAKEITEGAAVEMLDDNGVIVAAEDGTYVIESEEVQIEVEDGEIVTVEDVEVTEKLEEEDDKDKMRKDKDKMEKDKDKDKSYAKDGKEEEEKDKMMMDPETLAKLVELESRLEAMESKLAQGAAPEELTKFSKDASKAARLATLKFLLK